MPVFFYGISQQSKIIHGPTPPIIWEQMCKTRYQAQSWVFVGFPIKVSVTWDTRDVSGKTLRRGSLDDRANHSQKVLLGSLMGPFSFLEYSVAFARLPNFFEAVHVDELLDEYPAQHLPCQLGTYTYESPLWQLCLYMWILGLILMRLGRIFRQP